MYQFLLGILQFQLQLLLKLTIAGLAQYLNGSLLGAADVVGSPPPPPPFLGGDSSFTHFSLLFFLQLELVKPCFIFTLCVCTLVSVHVLVLPLGLRISGPNEFGVSTWGGWISHYYNY